jgi:hypothetical protein
MQMLPKKLKRNKFIGGEGIKRKSIEYEESFTSGSDVDVVPDSPKDDPQGGFV